jgi:hypothetical protein
MTGQALSIFRAALTFAYADDPAYPSYGQLLQFRGLRI